MRSRQNGSIQIAILPGVDVWRPLLIWSAPLLLTLFSTPVLVQRLSPTDYGSYSIGMALVAFSVLPPGGAAIFRFAVRVEQGAISLDQIVAIVLTIMLGAALANVLIFGLLNAAVGFNLPSAGYWQYALFFGSLAVLLGSTAMNQVLSAALQCRGQWTQVSWVLLLGTGLAPLVALLAALHNVTWISIICCQAAWAGASAMALALLFREMKTARRIWFPDTSESLAILKYLGHSGLASGIGSAMAIAERLLLGARIGPDAAGRFGIAMSLAILIHGLSYSLNLRLSNSLSSAFAARDHSSVQHTYRAAVRLTIAATGLALCLTLILGERFCELWLGDAFAREVHSLLTPLAIGMSGLAATLPTWVLASIVGRERANVVLMMSLLAAWALTAFVLLPSAGAQGLAYARMTIPVCCLFFVVAVERTTFVASLAFFWLGALWRAAWAGLACLLAIALLPDSGWIGFIMSASAGCIAFLTVAALSGLVQASDFSMTK